MKLRSVQFKFLITVISAMLAIAIFVGGLSTYAVDQYVQSHTKEFIDTSCSNEAAQVNDIFGDIENSVYIMESYLLSLFGRTQDIHNRDNQAIILSLAQDLFVDVAANTEGAIAYYMRFNPEISDSKAGFFSSKMNGSDEYVVLEPTDLSLYDKNDTEHVGWFWQPYDAGHPIWMDPYYNHNINFLIISFVVPLYFENQFVGVVGMDFDYRSLTDRVHQIKVFDHGFAHLELNDVIIHAGKDDSHGDHDHMTQEEMQDGYLQSSQDLTNGMKLVLFASYDDIRQIRYHIAYQIIFSVILLTAFFALIAFWTVKKVVKPLKELTNASIQIADGDFDVKIEHSDTYEVQQLSIAFEKMLFNLREHRRLQHTLAYRDALTGLRNTTSYKDWIIYFNKKIEEENFPFGAIVFDLNYLKMTNDTYGHNAGNKLIVTAAQIISSTFKRSPVFRIGGDEFVVILQNSDLEDRDLLFAKFEEECANALVETDQATLRLSIAKGFSMFDPTTDTKFSDVFNRADNEMYKNKNATKMAAV